MMPAGQRPIQASLSRCKEYQKFAAAFYGHPPSDSQDDRDKSTAFIAAFEPALSDKACSLNESTYVAEERSHLYEELVRFYDHFGLARQEQSELPDHLVVELEFMHFLSYLEYKCKERGENVEGVIKAQRDFLGRHLERLIGGISVHFGEDESNPYSRVVQELQRFIENELAWLNAYHTEE